MGEITAPSLTSGEAARYLERGLTTPHRSPGDARVGPSLSLAHTRAMRQWACVVALLLGLAGNGYATTARTRLPIAIERRLGPRTLEGGTLRTLDWWRA